ncbi:MAG: extracellular solute-binding protein [Acetobacteraceae bacterium]|nr:extracellular solute-binding protein [Acetobacteraceae bacterium]
MSHNTPRLTRRTLLAGAAALSAAGIRRAHADTVLQIWTGYPELVPWYQAVSADFAKAHGGVSANILSTTLREHEQKLNAAMPTGTGPDVFDVGTNITSTYADAGLIQPNSADVDAYLKKNWIPQAVDHFTMGGKSYGLPLLISNDALFWNKTYFKEAGLDAPPETFPDMMEDARKLVKIDGTGKMTRSGMSLRLSGQGSGICEKFRFVLEPAGGSIIAKTASGKYHQNYDNQAGRDALQFYIDAVQKYHVDDPKVQHDSDAFVAGNTAMLFREAWVIGEIQKKNPTLDYGVAMIPRWREGQPHKTLLHFDSLTVSGKSRNQKLAWDWVMFATQPAQMVKLTQMSGWVAARSGDMDWSPLIKQTPQYQVFVDPPKEMVYYLEPVLTPWDEIQTRVADQLPAAYVDPALKDDPKKVAELIHRLATQTDQLLREADLYGAA